MIAIINLDLGNLHSVARAIEHVGADAVITDDAQLIAKADKLILPGVGSFKAGMDALNKKKLTTLIQECAASGVPVLGICLGMQLLMSQSEEHGSWSGLGLIPGRVVYLKNMTGFNKQLKVPHINWCGIRKTFDKRTWDATILRGSDEYDELYFVHSLCVNPDDKSHTLAVSQYGGCEFASVILSGNVIGCQFHPEKSGKSGLEIIKNFVSNS